MGRTSSKGIVAIAAGGLAAAALAGCTSGGSSARPTVTRTATAPSTTVTATATSSPTSTAPSASRRCTTDQLAGAVGERNGAEPGTGNGANQQHVAVILTNTGSVACTLQGWPGVSLVGDGNGTQLGAAAQFDRSTPHATVNIAPGAKVQAPLDYVNAAVYDPGQCGPKAADGLRVYPPSSRTALFVAYPLQACTSQTHDLLTVGAFVSYP